MRNRSRSRSLFFVIVAGALLSAAVTIAGVRPGDEARSSAGWRVAAVGGLAR